MTARKAITPALIDALRKGILRDLLTPGLFVEVLPSGKKRWKYRRCIPVNGAEVRLSFALFPARTIAEARAWAVGLNEKIDKGVDPREVNRANKRRASMTVARAHALYMTAVRDGCASRAKRKNKPRTISDKVEIFQRDIAPKLGSRSIYEVTEKDLISLVVDKGKAAKVRANRLATELKVFFGWASSLRGMDIGLDIDPSRRLGDLRFPESPRKRYLNDQEIEWFLEALVEEEMDCRRGMLLWLLTGARLSEVVQARCDELQDGVWVIPSRRTKNSKQHRIPLGPWGQALFKKDGIWVFPAPKSTGPRSKSCWYKARDRVKKRMEMLSGRLSSSSRLMISVGRFDLTPRSSK
jgi:integrase